MSVPRCPNTPCKEREMKLQGENSASWSFQCTYCGCLSVRSKEHVSAEARWVKKMKADWEQEQLQRQKDSKRLIFT